MPGAGQVRLRVLACGVCRTDLHIVDGELPSAQLPLVLGHEIVGQVDALGTSRAPRALGDRVGVPWLAGTCGALPVLRAAGARTCATRAAFTGYTVDGGFADTPSPTRVLPAPARRPARRRGRAAPVRGPDRLSRAAHGRRAPSAGAVRIRRRGASGGAGRPLPGPAASMPSRAPATTARSASRWSSARRGPAAPTARRPGRSTPRSSSRRRASWCPLRCARSRGAARWSAAAST